MTKERKILLFSIILLFVFLIFPSIVNAADTYTTTSTINDVTVNWSYTLNDSNQITDLTCTNPSDLTGSITIPSSLDGKTVVTIGHDAFESATGITEVIIPDSVTEIEYQAFENCTNLNKVDLGNITSLSFEVFTGCTNLTEITIPKTLKNGAVSPCLDNPNITKITLEEGLTVVPSNLCANTGISEIVIPNSVTKIDSSAFANTAITEIVIPDSVTEIEYQAFENCTNLNKVDLGNITSLSFEVFTGCTNLTEITIPKTLKNGAVSPCLDNPNITKITLEEGLTVVPSNLCANTGISEIVIPDSVTEIEFGAFDDCTELKKITILDNVTDMGLYISSDSDSVFENHNEDLTIYCYEDSMAANYALKYDIKYVYLTKPSDESPDNNDQTDDENNNSNPDKTDDENNNDTNNEIYTGKNDPTVAPGKIPYAGFRIGFTVIIMLSVAGCIFAYMKYNKFKNI